MSDIEKCSCGKASAEFFMVEEDLFDAKTENTTTKRTRRQVEYKCQSCGEIYATADPGIMMK